MRKILLLAVVFATTFTAFGQNYSNKGKDFWISYPEHINGTTSLMGLYITSDVNTTGVISVNGSNIPFAVTANSISPRFIGTGGIAPNTYVHLGGLQDGIKTNAAIHVVAQAPVVVYAHIINAARSGATLALPTTVWGKEYILPSYANSGGSGLNQGYGELNVMASLPNTVVEIKPSITSRNGARAAGVPFQITLANPGDVYQLQFPQNADLSGTSVKSIASGVSGCQPIGVFSATTWSAINCGSGNGGDNFYQQLFPTGTWGKTFFTSPLKKVTTNASDLNVDIIRVYVKDPTTKVDKLENGVTVTLSGLNPIGNFYEYSAYRPTFLSADMPIQVVEYITTQNCGSPVTNSDPEMISLSSVEQTINDITVYSALAGNVPGGNSQISDNSHYINVITKTANIPTFKINGALPTSSFISIPGTVYSYLKQNISASAPVSRLTSDSGFNAYAYGFGNVESYGYNAGTNVRDLNTRLEVNNPNSSPTETEPSACTNSPFQFKVYFQDRTASSVPIRYDSIQWEVLSNAFNFVPNNFPVIIRPTSPSTTVDPDSVNIRNGNFVAWYSIPGLYYVNTAGVYPIRITLYKSTNEGCGNSIEYEFNLIVTDPPTASFQPDPASPLPGCYLEPVVMKETTSQIPKTTYRQWWEFFDPVANITTVYTNYPSPPNSPTPIRTVSHTFTTPGVKRIRHVSITTPGCISDTIVQTIDLPRIADGSIAGNTTVCANTANPNVTFTFIDGRAPYRFTYTINGVVQPAIVSPTGTYTLSVPTATPGTYIYELTEVRNDGSSVCVRPITGQTATVVVRPLPNAAIGGVTTVCLNSAAPTVTFTGSNATAPYTFAYTINGIAQTPVVSNAAGIATVTAPTTVPGTFIYEITQVTEASSTTCSSNITGTTTTITVQDLPNAAISGSTTEVCKNAAQPTITFTGSGGTAVYTFNYTINSIAQPPVVSNAAGVATLNVPTTTVGTYVYEITQVREASAQTCLRAITGQIFSVTVNPLPNAAIAGATTVCLNSAPDPIVTFTGSNATAPYTFTYTINGIPQPPVVSNAAGIATVNAPTTAVGTFVYAINQVTDASGTACSSAISGTSTTIVIKDLPNGVIAGSSTTACLNSTPLPTITFTGNTGTAPYTFNYTINTVTQPPVVSNAAGVATINVPTNVATTYTYELTSVSESSAQACARNITGQTRVVVINPLPVASVAGATAVCRNDPQPIVTFTGSGATAPYTFNYTINTVAQPPLISNAAGIATITAPTNVAGTFTYQLTSVTDASSTACSQLQNGSTVITINQLPVAGFNAGTPRCANNAITFNNTSTANAATASYDWTFNDPNATAGNPNTVTTNTASPNATHFYLVPGTYNVTMLATNSNGCISSPPASVLVVVNDTPRAGFIVPDVCINDVATTFTDTSKIATGTINRPANQWNYGDPFATPGNPNTSTGVNGSHLYTQVGTYFVTQTVTSNITGCTNSKTLPIVISSADPVADFTSINSCSSDSVDLVNKSRVTSGNVTRIEIQWDFVGNPAAVQTITAPTFNGIYRHKYPTLQTTQTYTIRMTAYSGVICFNSFTQQVTVYATPVALFNNPQATCLIRAPFQLVASGSPSGGIPNFTSTSPGVSSTGMFDPQIAGVGTHAIKFTYTLTGPGGCFDTLTRFITVRDTAHAKFSVVLPACEQTPVSFTDLSTAPASVTLASTVWNFGDGTGIFTFPAGSTFTHTFALPLNRTVTMHTVSDAATGGCLSTDTMAVVMIDANQHIALTSANNTQTLCVNNPITQIRYQLSGGSNNIVIPASGLPPGVVPTVTGNIVTLDGSPTLAGTYNYTLRTLGTCQDETVSGVIDVKPDDIIALNAASTGNDIQSVCVGTGIKPIVYDLGGGATGIQSIVPALPAGLSALPSNGGATLTIKGIPSATTTGPVVYTITTNGNCVRANTTFSIDVHAYPVPSFSFDKTSYCIPNAIVMFTNTTTPTPLTNQTYKWEFGDPNATVSNPDTSHSLNPTHQYTSVGPFTVKLTATSTDVLNDGVIGCSLVLPQLLTTVHPQPKVNRIVPSEPGVCVGGDIIFTADVDGMGALPREYYWYLGNSGDSARGNPISKRFGTDGTYNMTIFSVNDFGCVSDTFPYQFTVYPYPAQVNAGPDKFVLEGGSVELEASASALEPTYIWTPVEFLSSPNVLRPRVVDPKTDMTYRLTVRGKGGCESFDDVFVKLLKFPTIPNTFTPNGDGTHDKWVIEFLNTYPNNRVQIFTRSGNLIFESRGYNTPWDGTFKGKPMPFDTYYYIIEPGNGRDPITGYVTILK